MSSNCRAVKSRQSLAGLICDPAQARARAMAQYRPMWLEFRREQKLRGQKQQDARSYYNGVLVDDKEAWLGCRRDIAFGSQDVLKLRRSRCWKLKPTCTLMG
jgi:hypothetical protein